MSNIKCNHTINYMSLVRKIKLCAILTGINDIERFMKKLIFIIGLSVLLLPSYIFSQEKNEGDQMKTLITKENIRAFFINCYEEGIYFAVEGRVSVVGDSYIPSRAFRTGFNVNENLALGYFSNKTQGKERFYGTNYKGELVKLSMDNKSWGMAADVIFIPKSPVRVSFPIYAGFGHTRIYYDNYYNGTSFINNELEDSWYVFAEPGMNIDLHLVKHVYLKLGASYKIAGQSDLLNLTDMDLSGPSVNINLTYKIFGP